MTKHEMSNIGTLNTRFIFMDLHKFRRFFSFWEWLITTVYENQKEEDTPGNLNVL